MCTLYAWNPYKSSVLVFSESLEVCNMTVSVVLTTKLIRHGVGQLAAQSRWASGTYITGVTSKYCGFGTSSWSVYSYAHVLVSSILGPVQAQDWSSTRTVICA